MAYIYTPLSEDYDTRVLELSPRLGHERATSW